MNKLHRYINYYTIGILIGLLIIVLFSFNWIQNLELITYDYRMILKSQFQFNTQEEIVVVTIDDQSINKLGTWPWPRRYHAQLIAKLNQAGAKTIAFDILFQNTRDDDEVLAQAMAEANNVILPYKLDVSAYRNTFDFSNTEYKVNNIKYPVAEFRKNTSEMGYLNLLTDHEGTIRRLHLLNHEGSKPFAISIAEDYSKQSKVFQNDELLLDFKAAQGYFKEIPYYQVLNNNFNPKLFQDKIVLIGAKGNSFQDYLATPLAAIKGYLPGVMIHATIIDNYLEDSFMQQLETPVIYLLTILFSILIAWIYYQLSPIYSLVSSILILISVVIINLAIFVYFDFFIPLLPFALVVIINLIISLLSWYLKIERRRSKLKTTLGRYLAPEVIKEVLQLSEENYLQGQRKDITVLFVDINSFTEFSEKHSSQEVVTLLNKYLTLITEVTFAHAGTLDKFLGDGVMIFFNAPTKQTNHAIKAVNLAIDLQNKIQDDPELPLSISIGINTGPAVIGNIGSTKRSDYTAIGDVVNTAARIEGITPGNEIYIGDGTWQKLGNKFEVQLKSKVRLKGKSKNQSIYRIFY